MLLSFNFTDDSTSMHLLTYLFIHLFYLRTLLVYDLKAVVAGTSYHSILTCKEKEKHHKSQRQEGSKPQGGLTC